MPPAPQGRIKGTAIREFVAWYRRENGIASLVGAIEALPAEQRSLFDLDERALGILPSTWYPMAPIHAVLDAVTRDLMPGELDALAMAGGEETVRRMMRGIYKVVFGVLTPRSYVRVVNVAWKLNYDGGWVENRILSPTRHQGITREWTGHHRLLCRMNVAAKRAIYQAIGAKDAIIESRYCVDDGDAECGSVITWSRE